MTEGDCARCGFPGEAHPAGKPLRYTTIQKDGIQECPGFQTDYEALRARIEKLAEEFETWKFTDRDTEVYTSPLAGCTFARRLREVIEG